MNIRSYKLKTILPSVVILTVLVTAITVITSVKFSHFTSKYLSESITLTAMGLQTFLEDCKRDTMIAAVSAALRDDVVQAVKARDTSEILTVMSRLDKLYKANFYTITDGDGIVIARTHAHNSFGDNISTQRNISEALAGNVSAHTEEGVVVKVSVRSSAPVYDADNNLIGVISAGVRLDTDDSLDALTERFDNEFTLYLGEVRIATSISIDGESIVGTRLDPAIAKTVIGQKQEYFGVVDIFGEKYHGFYMPIINPHGDVFSIIFAGSSYNRLVLERNAMIRSNLLIGLTGLAVSMAVLLYASAKSIKPVKRLMGLVSDVTNGNVDVDIDDTHVTKDEIGALTLDVYSLIGVIKSMLSDLSKLTDELNIYSEIDFQIDMRKYSGSFKEIIEGINTLVHSISMMNKAMVAMDYQDTMISVVDMDYNLLYANRKLADTYGIDRETCLQQKCYRVIRNFDKPCDFCQMPVLMPDKDTLPYIAYHDRWDEPSGKWLGGTAAIMNWVDGSKVLLSSMNDETENKESKARLRDALEKAEVATAAKSTFLAHMSHEIRTPMNAIIGMSELLLNEPMGKQQRELVGNINSSANMLLYIINDILDMSKIEAGKLALSPVDYDFQAFIHDIANMFKQLTHGKEVEFIFESEGELPECLYGDDLRLRQVITNVCGNAVKYTQRGYVRLKVAFKAGKLIFKVTDTGVGIKKEYIDEIFNAFEQHKTEMNRHVVGAGLGLTISKALVEMMDGGITLESEYGYGTVVTVVIPVTAGNRARIKTKKTARDIHALHAPAASVLIVDDNKLNQNVARGLLRLFGIEAKTADSGIDAISMVTRDEYDIIFMDHMMPDMDGVETAIKIRRMGAIFENIPIIALTANAVRGAKEMFLANGLSDFIAKPIDTGELHDILVKWLPPDKITIKKEPDPAAEGGGKAGAGVSDEANAETETKSRDTASRPEPNRGLVDALRDIGQIDVDIGLSRVNGDKAWYLDIVGEFYRKLAAGCFELTAFLDSSEIKRFAISIHTMKSLLATIGAMQLSQEAFALETAANGGDISCCNNQFPIFRNKLYTLYERLSAILPAKGDEDGEAPEGTAS